MKKLPFTRSVLSSFVRALFFPAKIDQAFLPFRQLLRTPVIFDLISWTLQVKDLALLATIKSSKKVSDEYIEKVYDYNAGVTIKKLITSTRRAEHFYRILCLPFSCPEKERLLIIGPRNIQELFIAWLYGFSWKNILGIDLYSTNKKIQVMNMEDMSFDENTFDAVAMANTLSYAKDTRTAIAEIARVMKPGARLSFSATYDPNDLWPEDSRSASEIKQILHDNNLNIYYFESFDKVNSQGRLQTSHSFGATKALPTPLFDQMLL